MSPEAKHDVMTQAVQAIPATVAIVLGHSLADWLQIVGIVVLLIQGAYWIVKLWHAWRHKP